MPPSRTALPSIEPTIAILTTSGRFARSASTVIASSATLPNADCTMPTTLGESRPRSASVPFATSGATSRSGALAAIVPAVSLTA